MTRLILVRNGLTQSNMKGLFLGKTDVSLDPIGIMQSSALAKRVNQDYTIDIIYSSPLKRAYDTAKVIKGRRHMPIVTAKYLQELDFGQWEGHAHEEIYALYKDNFIQWETKSYAFQIPGGQSLQDLFNTIRIFFEIVSEENRGKTALFVTHGVTLRVMMCYLTGVPLESIHDFPWFCNAAVTVLEGEENHREIVCINDISHLSGSLNPPTYDIMEGIIKRMVI